MASLGEMAMRISTVVDQQSVNQAMQTIGGFERTLKTLFTGQTFNLDEFKKVKQEIAGLDAQAKLLNNTLKTLSSAGVAATDSRVVNANAQKTAIESARAVQQTRFLELQSIQANGGIGINDPRKALAGMALNAAADVPRAIGQIASSVLGTFKNLFDLSAGILRNLVGWLNPFNVLLAPVRSLERSFGNIWNLAGVFMFQGAFNKLGQSAVDLVMKLNPIGPLVDGIIQTLGRLGPAASIGEAGRLEQQMKALESTAANMGYNIREVNAAISELRGQGIMASEAIQSMSQAMQAGLTPNQIQRLARAGQDMAQIIGGTSTQAFERMFNAVTTGHVALLRTMGIMATQDQIINRFAASTGRTYNEIRQNATLMKQAFLEGIIIESNKYAGAYEASMETVAKRVSSLQRLVDDFVKSADSIFTPFMSGGLGVVESALDTITGLFIKTKAEALNTAAAMFSTQYSVKLTSDNLKNLSGALRDAEANTETSEKKWTKWSETFQKTTGITKDQLDLIRKQVSEGKIVLGGQEFFSILEAGGAFKPTKFAEVLRQLSAVAGRGFEDFGKRLVQAIFGDTSQSLDEWAANFEAQLPVVAQRVGQRVAEFVDWVVSGLTTIVARVAEFVANASTELSAAGQQLVGWLQQGVVAGGQLLEQAIAGWANNLRQGFTNFFSFFGNELKAELASGPVYAKIDEVAGGLSMEMVDAIYTQLQANAGIAQDKVEEWYAKVVSTGDLQQEDLQRLVPALTPIKYWMLGVRKGALDLLKSEDFGELNFLGSFLEKLMTTGGQGQTPLTLRAVELVRNNLSEILAQIRRGEEYSQETFQAMLKGVEEVSPEVARYIELWVKEVEVKKAERQYQIESLELNKRAMEAEIALRNFQRASADIPERYTRGRQRQLQAEIDAINVEKQRREQAHSEQQLQNQILQEQLQAQKALMGELERAAAANAHIYKSEFDAAVQGFQAKFDSSDMDATFKRAANKMGEAIQAGLRPARLALLELANFFLGAFGGEMVTLDPFPKPDQKDFKTVEEFNAKLAEWQTQFDALNAPNRARFKAGEALRTNLEDIAKKIMPDIHAGWERLIALIVKAIGLVGAFAQGLFGGKVDPMTKAAADAGDKDAKDILAAFDYGQQTAKFGQFAIKVAIEFLGEAGKWLDAIKEWFFPDGKLSTERVLQFTLLLAGTAALPGIFNLLKDIILMAGALGLIGQGSAGAAGVAAAGAGAAAGTGLAATVGAVLLALAATALAVKMGYDQVKQVDQGIKDVDNALFQHWADIEDTSPSYQAYLEEVVRSAKAAKDLWGRQRLAGSDQWTTAMFGTTGADIKGENGQLYHVLSEAAFNAYQESNRQVAAAANPDPRDEGRNRGAPLAVSAQTSAESGDLMGLINDVFNPNGKFGANQKLGLTLQVGANVQSEFKKLDEFIRPLWLPSGKLLPQAKLTMKLELLGADEVARKLAPVAKVFIDIGFGKEFSDKWKGTIEAYTAFFERLQDITANMSPKMIENIRKLTAAVKDLFKNLGDELVFHSIVPDMINAIGDQFGRLPELAVKPADEMTGAVVDAMSNVDTTLKGGSKLTAAGKTGSGVEVTVNQTGWVFPSGLDDAQKAILRTLAREEAYSGVVIALQAAGA